MPVGAHRLARCPERRASVRCGRCHEPSDSQRGVGRAQLARGPQRGRAQGSRVGPGAQTPLQGSHGGVWGRRRGAHAWQPLLWATGGRAPRTPLGHPCSACPALPSLGSQPGVRQLRPGLSSAEHRADTPRGLSSLPCPCPGPCAHSQLLPSAPLLQRGFLTARPAGSRCPRGLLEPTVLPAVCQAPTRAQTLAHQAWPR